MQEYIALLINRNNFNEKLNGFPGISVKIYKVSC